jgi:hypothetical protein
LRSWGRGRDSLRTLVVGPHRPQEPRLAARSDGRAERVRVFKLDAHRVRRRAAAGTVALQLEKERIKANGKDDDDEEEEEDK